MSSTRPQISRSSFLTGLLLVALSVLLLWNLGYAPLWNPDEGRYAAAALEMAGGVEGGNQPDHVVPHLNTIPRLNKPPLIYWLTSTFIEWFGPHEWVVRLAPALAAIGVMLVLWRMAGAMFSPAAGVLSALVWATSTLPFALARFGNTDMLLTFSIVLAMWGLWGSAEFGVRSAESDIEEPLFRIPYMPFALAGLGFGLAMLSKGPVGVALPLLIIAGWLGLTWRWRAVNWKGVAVMAGVAFLIFAPWYLAVAQREPAFLRNFLLGENLARFSGGKEFHDPTPFWYYAPVVLLGLLPWTPLLIPALVRLSTPGQNPLRRRARSLLWLWAGLLVLFFSISSTKLISYVLPAFPALAILIGEALGGFHRRTDKEGMVADAGIPETEIGWHSGWRTLAGILALLLNIALAVAAGFYLLNEKTVPQDDIGLPYFFIALGILFLSTLAVAAALSFGSRTGLATVQGITALTLFLLLMRIANTVALYEDASAMILALKPHLQEGDRVVQYASFDPALTFYLQKPITYIRFKNTSGLAPEAVKKSPYFAADRPGLLIELLERPQPIYILMRRKSFRWVTRDMNPIRGYVVGRNNNYVVWSNRNDAQDFFRHIAPREF